MDHGSYSGLAYRESMEFPPDMHSHPLRRERSTHFGDLQHPTPPYNHQALAHLACDVKPRLTKEQHDILEAEYQKQNKPNTNTKKGFAEALGVSLDKVNNWFQNRRAKSKQDAKKQAGAFNLLQANQTGPSSLTFSEDYSPAFCPPDFTNNVMNNQNFLDDGLSNGQSYVHQMGGNHLMARDSVNSFTMGGPMDSGVHLGSMGHDFSNDGSNRRTLTQEQFDAFAQAQGGSFLQASSGDSMDNMTAMDSDPNNLSDYFPELCNFQFPEQSSEPLGSQPMQPNPSSDSYTTDSSAFSDAPSLSTYASTDNLQQERRDISNANSDWSDASGAPSVHLTPATQAANPFEFVSPVSQSSLAPPTQPTTTTAQWQPGQSVPADFAAYDREFRELKLRSQSIPNVHAQYVEEPLAYPTDDSYGRRDSSAAGLTLGMHNIGISPRNGSPPKARMPSSGIAARRQRPRPAPLGQASLRSASFCGPMPPSPNVINPSQNLVAGGQTLRRIKSNNVMNGIAGGRIQKNSCSSAQRSPLNFNFAEASPGYGRRASAFAGMPSSASLAPPTPLSPSEHPRGNSISIEAQRAWPPWQTQNQNSRQPSISESDAEFSLPGGNPNANSTTFSSPPTTPMYPPNFMRQRLGSTTIHENTPPQSAPATQQSFPNMSMAPVQPQMQQTAGGQVPQPQFQGMMQGMPNEFTQMGSGLYPMQQFQVPVSGPYMEMPMQYVQAPMMAAPGNMPMGYMTMPVSMPQHPTPPNMQYPFVPSSGAGMVSSGVPKQQQPPAADLFIHEYSPPQSIKQAVATPRRAADTGPKSYQFANSGPEHYERGKKEQQASSPLSSTGSAGSS